MSHYLLENVTEQVKLQTLGDALFFVLFQMKNVAVVSEYKLRYCCDQTTAIWAVNEENS